MLDYGAREIAVYTQRHALSGEPDPDFDSRMKLLKESEWNDPSLVRMVPYSQVSPRAAFGVRYWLLVLGMLAPVGLYAAKTDMVRRKRR